MSLTQIGLHPTTQQVLQNLLKNKRLAHAYIFYGNAQHKKAAAIEFAKAVNCQQLELDACSQCATCKMIEHGNHPDVISIQPQGNSIKIDTLRQLRKKLYYQAPSGFTRFVIIEEAEKMRAEAANSVLKFLEEPPSSMVVILITDQVQSILPTIQSRCQKIRFFPSPLQERIQHYRQRGYPEHLVSIAAQFDRDLAMTAEELEQLLHQTILFADQLLSDAIDEALLTMVHWSQAQLSAYTAELLDALLFWLREIAYFQATGNVQYFTHWRATLEKQASKQTKSLILMAIDNVMIARRLLNKTPLKPQEIIEQMVLAIHQRTLSHDNGWQLIFI